MVSMALFLHGPANSQAPQSTPQLSNEYRLVTPLLWPERREEDQEWCTRRRVHDGTWGILR